MAALSVRVSEDPARPLGHAIITLNGLPRGLETFEFALSRHGFSANHLGLDGWQGAESWLQPEEAWYSGDALKFVIHSDLVFQLENMPYQLAVRGQGLDGVATATFAWPLQLELEEGSASAERNVVGGTRVNPAPTPRTAPAAPPEIKHPDVAVPEVSIPKIDAFESEEDDRTRVAPNRGQSVPPAMTGREGEDSAAPPPLPAAPAASDHPARAPASAAPAGAAESAASAERGRREAEARDAAAPAGRGGSGWLAALIGALVLAALAGAAWWWFGQQAGKPAPVSPVERPAPSTAPAGPQPSADGQAVPASPRSETALRPAPEPRAAPEPVPAPEPQPAPEPRPAPEPPVVPPVPPRLEPPPAPPVAPPSRQSAPSQQNSRARPNSGRSLEEELKSQFDPTVQELEQRLRRQKPSP
ncbi:MAG: hypothetical protein JNK31_04680 [Candidatus Competibacter sp.]|nr:hypothetical protein [Candidatus Competibacter sp.]